MTTDQLEQDEQPLYDLLTDFALDLESVVAPASLPDDFILQVLRHYMSERSKKIPDVFERVILPNPHDGQPEGWLRIDGDFKGYAVTLAREYLDISCH